jgi:potassium/hydrogen antiporter
LRRERRQPLILIAGGLLIAGLLATVVAGRLRVPGLVLFIGLGMAIGSDGTGWIDFADYELARTIGVVALALILFEGGLSVGFGEIRPVLGASLALAIPGTLLTAAISGLAPQRSGSGAPRRGLDRLDSAAGLRAW